VGSSPNQFRALYDLLGRMTSAMRAQTEGANCILDVRALASSTTFDRFRKPYSVDEARQLIAGIGILRDQTFPRDGFADLSDHVARGSAGLYYTFERSKLPDAGRAVLQRLERAWDMGSAAGPRFYAMLSDALKLARLSD
jgi:hypothetical protein